MRLRFLFTCFEYFGHFVVIVLLQLDKRFLRQQFRGKGCLVRQRVGFGQDGHKLVLFQREDIERAFDG